MTAPIVVMIIIGVIFIIVSFFITEKILSSKENVDKDLLAITDDYQFSEREIQIIKTKIEDVIARQAKDILYETNDSLSSMANEKTIALGDYAVTVCDEIEKNHREVMFLYSMLDDKQKEIMETVKRIDSLKLEVKELIQEYEALPALTKNESGDDVSKEKSHQSLDDTEIPKNSALDQLTSLKQSYEENVKKDDSDKSNQEKITTANTVSSHQKDSLEDPSSKESDNYKIENSDTITHDMEDDNEIDENDLLDVDVEDIEDEDIFAEIDEKEINLDEVLEEEFKDQDNSNDIILEMHRNGSSILEIAKQLGLGVGEVRLVIDLYQGE